MSEVTYRQASLDDAAEIHELLLRVASEIPLLTDTLEREEALYALIRTCTRSGESWVACDGAGRTIGFVLVELIDHGRHFAENEVLELHHAGVASEHRRHGIFAALMDKVLARLVPVATSVSQQNHTGAAAQFHKLGFRSTGSGDARLRWEPAMRPDILAPHTAGP